MSANSTNFRLTPGSKHPQIFPNLLHHQALAALEHLASIDPIDLCNEAKIERCRATRDLRSCGRNVEKVLISCGHASLCEECSQRCDVCPICRIPLPKEGNRLRLRLYYTCIDGRLISNKHDDRLQQNKEDEDQLVADVQRLYSLFDVALDNNLVSLICHYVTDVCMDESAVSSDPVLAFLLDEKVIKDWCKRTFKNILTELHVIYNLTAPEMKERMSLLLKISVKLSGLSNVLEVLESSFGGSVSANLKDLHHLQEDVVKTKQHLEILIWCIGHQFLENIRSRHSNLASWRLLVQERKAAAVKRAWPDSMNKNADSVGSSSSTLFIEDALSNLEIEKGHGDHDREEYALASLRSDAKYQGVASCYPFENLRAAADILFLRGGADMVVAKQAIFLYYLFDRHWTLPDEDWRYIIDDFAATFSITRHSLLESLTFYLLDDHSDEALQEASQLLPEIAGPALHPKVALALLERQNPDAALMVLRWCGRDGGATLVSLGEAITAVRVRVECGLLTEAFMYQRTMCTKIKDKKLRDAPGEVKNEYWSRVLWLEALVTEICCLCIRRNLVDRMIELPWNHDEEKYIHRCLLDFAVDDPLTTAGSLLVVYYLQRYRYTEAYQVDVKLQTAEEDYISNHSITEEASFKMRSASHWRKGLVGRALELMPEILKQQIRSGEFSELAVSHDNEVTIPASSDLPELQGTILGSLLVPSSFGSSSTEHSDIVIPPVKPSSLRTPLKVGEPLNMSSFSVRNHGSVVQTDLFNKSGKELKARSAFGVVDDSSEIKVPVNSWANTPNASSLGNFHGSSSRLPQNSFLKYRSSKVSPNRQDNGSFGQGHLSRLSHARVKPKPRSSPGSISEISDYWAQESYSRIFSKGLTPGTADDLPWMEPANDLMDVSRSHEMNGGSAENTNTNSGHRWRLDESSDDEDHSHPDVVTGITSYTKYNKGNRKSRYVRK